MNLLKSRKILFLVFIVAISLVITACSASSGGEKGTVNIGYQKNATTLSLISHGALEEELEELGYSVTWSEFNTGSSILEALSAGSIDLANVGDVPSLFALDKGSNFQYVGSEPSSPATQGILVSGDSDIETLEDLKGRKVAYNNASIAQYLLTKALESVGLSIDDVETVHLNPPDASLAFEKGEVDAWVVWDPYYVDAEARGNKILQSGEGIVPLRGFYTATADIIENSPEVVELFVEHLALVGKTIDEDPTEAAQLLENETGIPASTWELGLARKHSIVQFIDEQAIGDLELIANDLLEIGLIENELDFSGKVWKPSN